MSTLLVAIVSFVGFIITYHAHGRRLTRQVLGLNPNGVIPSHELRHDVDTIIAGAAPIVGSAIAAFGAPPASLWGIFRAIFIGAVHDLGVREWALSVWIAARAARLVGRWGCKRSSLVSLN